MGRRPGATNIDWVGIVARLRRTPGRWVLLPEMAAVPDRTINTIRRRERRALRLDDGFIRCRRKATVWTEGGVMCTLFLQFHPTTREETNRNG